MMAGIIYFLTGCYDKSDRARAAGLARLARCLEWRHIENLFNTNGRIFYYKMSF